MPVQRRAAAVLGTAMITLLITGAPSMVRAAEGPTSTGKAAPRAAAAQRFDVKTSSCQQFLDLAPAVRGLVVAWTAGRYGRHSEQWIVDEAVAPRAVANLEKACADRPDASYWYRVTTELKIEAKKTSQKAKQKK